MKFLIKTVSNEFYLWDPKDDPNFKNAHTKRSIDYMRNYAIYAKCISTNQYMNLMPNSIEGYAEIDNEAEIKNFIK